MIFASSSAFSENPFESGIKEFANENYEEALQYFLEARALEPHSSRVAYFLGLTCKKMEDYKQAVPYLKDSVTYEPRIKEGLTEFVDALIRTNEIDEAMKWLATGEKEGVQSGRLQFLKGVALYKEKKYTEAITCFGIAAQMEPALKQAADFEIANAYMRLGEWKQARARLRQVITADPGTDYAMSARQYESQVSEKIEQERPFRFAVDLGYKYDTNVAVMPTSGPVADFISGQRDTALNAALRAAYTAPFSFTGPFNFSVQYALSADRYFRRDDFNSMTNVLTALPGYTFGASSITVPFSYTYAWLQRSKGEDFLNDGNWYTDTRYFQQLGVAPTYRHALGLKDMAEFSLGYLDKKYFVDLTNDFALASDPNENRDGSVVFGSVGWSHFFMGGKGVFSLKYTYSDEDTKGANWANRSSRFDLFALSPIKGRWKGQISGSAGFTDYTHVNSIFDMQRINNTYSGSAALIYELAKNVDLIGQYGYIRDKSNVSVYDYKREIFSLSLEYRY